MIGIVALNPAVDKCLTVKKMKCGEVVRAQAVETSAGGKGFNVARVARLLQEPVAAAAFLGGAGGSLIEAQMNELGVVGNYVRINGETRNCLAILDQDGQQTEVLEPGPDILPEEWAAMLTAYERMLGASECICASGSLPQRLSEQTYRILAQMAGERKIPFLLDSSGAALEAALAAKPFLIKPNRAELAEFWGDELKNERQMIDAIRLLQARGAQNIVLSLGADGAIAVLDGKLYRAKAPRIGAVNPVGSGDSMLAGLAVSLRRGYTAERMLKFACACGSANAEESSTGVVNLRRVDELSFSTEVRCIDSDSRG